MIQITGWLSTLRKHVRSLSRRMSELLPICHQPMTKGSSRSLDKEQESGLAIVSGCNIERAIIGIGGRQPLPREGGTDGHTQAADVCYGVLKNRAPFAPDWKKLARRCIWRCAIGRCADAGGCLLRLSAPDSGTVAGSLINRPGTSGQVHQSIFYQPRLRHVLVSYEQKDHVYCGRNVCRY